MENKSGFYKKSEDGLLQYSAHSVISIEYVLVSEEKDNYAYPIDGWIWAESEEEAKRLLQTVD